MLLQLMILFLACGLFGAYGKYLAMTDPRAANFAPIATSAMFAGIGFFTLLGMVSPVVMFSPPSALGFAMLLFAPLAGSIAGALLGYRHSMTGMREWAKS